MERVRADAIVVLGCRIDPSGRLPGPASRRAAAAAAAWRDGAAPVIVASGGRRWGEHVEARAMRRALVEAGVEGAAIVEELCSLSTCENAIFSAAALRRLGARSAAIVTCPWHMERALANFRAAGVDALPLPAPPGPASIARRVYRQAREVVSGWLDARTMRRARPLALRLEAM